MRRASLRLGLGVCVLIAAAGCGGPRSSATSRSMVDDPSCPLLVPGTTVAVEDTATGAALVFTTTGDPYAVRARAATLADMHAQQNGPAGALGMRLPTKTTAIATEADAGARVELAVSTAEGVPALQKSMRALAGRLRAAGCSM